MNTYLVLVRRPHALDDLLRLLVGDPALLRDDLDERRVDLARHVRRVSADVDVALIQEHLVDLLGPLLEAVLHVDLGGSLAGEGGDELELVAEDLLVLLEMVC